MDPEDIGRILDELGERIGPAGQYVWQLTVRQVVIEGWLWGIAAIVGASAWLYVTWRLFHGNGEPSDSQAGLAVFWLLPAGMTVLFVAIGGAIAGTKLLNPEYHAMIRLLEQLP